MAAALPWVYDYTDENRVGGDVLERALLRPTVPLQLVGDQPSRAAIVALVDSGCDHVLAPDWMAMEVGIRPDPATEIHLQIGGAVRRIHFAEATLRLCPPKVLNPPECPVEETLQWRASVGFFQEWSDPRWLVVLGQCGFFDQFTITMSRHAQQLAISRREDFDERHTTTGAR